MAHVGLHHVTAISGPARRNLGFYTGTLGLRLVKKTVNFDDPGTYHLYYGDESGQPGTILTFFPWDHVAPGRPGAGETQETAFRIPRAAIGYWMQRLAEAGVALGAPETRLGESVLRFKDPDGMALALIGGDDVAEAATWTGGDIPAEHAIRGFHSVSLLLNQTGATAAILQDVFGFEAAGQEGDRSRFRSATDSLGGVVDLVASASAPAGRMGGGSVHHVAFRAADDAAQAEMVRKLATGHGLRTTEQKDRNYFRSVYFREPGGVLFEIATDVPGFAADEPLASLGEALKLPPFLESARARIEQALPALV
jgi:glyoxalase family protein